MNSSKLISTIIVTFNSEKWIENCVNSLITQHSDFKQEIIIVDNNSTDNTVNIIEREFASKIKLIKSSNIGFGAGNNLGVKHAQGDYLFFVNPDTVAAKNSLAILINPLVNENVVTTPKITILNNEDKINTCGNLLHFTGFGFVNHFEAASKDFTEDFTVPAISGAAFAMRKETFIDLGMFDEDFFLYMEDSELSWRINKAKLPVLCCTNTTVAHEYEFKLSAQKIAFLEKGRIMIIRKHYSHWQQFLLLPSLILALGFSLIMSLKFGLSGVQVWLKALITGYCCKLTTKSHCYKSNIKQKIPFNLFSSNIVVKLIGTLINIFFNINQFIMKVFSNG